MHTANIFSRNFRAKVLFSGLGKGSAYEIVAFPPRGGPANRLCCLAQLRVTSFKSNGDSLGPIPRWSGLYKVEWANAASGPWYAFDSQTSLNAIRARTNRVSVQVPASNQPAFYRVGWIWPEV